MKIDPDRLSNIDLREASNAAMAVIDATQIRFSKEAQLVGLCAAFRIIAEDQGLSVPELMGRVTTIMNWADGRRPEFAAVQAYVREELN